MDFKYFPLPEFLRAGDSQFFYDAIMELYVKLRELEESSGTKDLDSVSPTTLQVGDVLTVTMNKDITNPPLGLLWENPGDDVVVWVLSAYDIEGATFSSDVQGPTVFPGNWQVYVIFTMDGDNPDDYSETFAQVTVTS